MTHDPLCPTHNCLDSNCHECCECRILARADERGATRALDKARDLISALVCPLRECKECDPYREALACIESLRGDS